MSRLKTSLLTAATVVTVGGTVLAGSAMAATSATNGSNTLVDKIASKFNLNKDEVQKVVNEVRSEKEAEHQQKMSEYLQTKVDDKTITAEQKILLENKLKELHTQREANRDNNLTMEQRREAMKTDREAFKKWADDNNIPLDSLKLQGPGMGNHGPGGMHGPDN